MKFSRLAPLCGVLLLAVVACGCSKLKARDQLNKGVAAYRNANFQAAIMHFKEAVRLDPALLNARLYLATAYAQQYIPGGESPDNLKVGEQAITVFEDVLKMAPPEDKSAVATALASIAQIYYNMKRFDQAKEYQRRRLEVEPNNPEPYYWIGVINWAVCFQRGGQLRKDLNLHIPDAKTNELKPLPEKDRVELEKENGPLVEEGLNALQKALDLKPNDSDAMAYMNLLYRQKADIESEARAREADLKQAEDWVEKALALKKAAAERAAAR